MSTTHIIILLVVVLLVFGTSKLKTIGSDLGSAVRGFKKAMGDGEDEQNRQLSDLTGGAKDADFAENASAKTDSKPSA